MAEEGATIVNRSADTVTIDSCILGPCNDLGFLLPNLAFGAGRYAGEIPDLFAECG